MAIIRKKVQSYTLLAAEKYGKKRIGQILNGTPVKSMRE